MHIASTTMATMAFLAFSATANPLKLNAYQPVITEVLVLKTGTETVVATQPPETVFLSEQAKMQNLRTWMRTKEAGVTNIPT
ncbi:hypothetical protein P7C71_g6199, partial [Lecanoromycetidae sp. Uapishka_2]